MSKNCVTISQMTFSLQSKTEKNNTTSYLRSLNQRIFLIS